MGFYSLAAAAAGRQVEAYESGQLDLLSFQASSAYNAMTEAIRLHQVRPLLMLESCCKIVCKQKLAQQVTFHRLMQGQVDALYANKSLLSE